MKRKKYFIHPSIQLKYITMSILPALILSIFTAYVLLANGSAVINQEHQELGGRVSASSQIIKEALRDRRPTITSHRLLVLQKNIFSIQKILRKYHLRAITRWKKVKFSLFVVCVLVMFCVGILALLYSFRIAGAIYRLRKYIDLLAKGKNSPPVNIRKSDEFKEVADSLEKLRRSLEKKGVLE